MRPSRPRPTRPNIAGDFCSEMGYNSTHVVKPRTSNSGVTSLDSIVAEGMAITKANKRKSASEIYPKLPHGHPHWDVKATNADLFNLIRKFPKDRQTRHFTLPAYFNKRGQLVTGNKEGKALLTDWISESQKHNDDK